MPFDPNPLDGLLFYNKKVNYLPGSTPLVGWLKGYMVPELLNIEVSKELMSQRPNSYANMGNYIKEYDEERKNLKKSPEKKPENMEEIEKSENQDSRIGIYYCNESRPATNFRQLSSPCLFFYYAGLRSI